MRRFKFNMKPLKLFDNFFVQLFWEAAKKSQTKKNKIKRQIKKK